MSRRAAIAVYGVLALVFVGTRLMLLWRFPPHVDEAAFAEWTLRGFEDPEARFIALTAGNQPLLEWLGMLVMGLGVEPLTALRLVSLGAMLATGGLVVWLADRLWGQATGVVAGFLWVLLPITFVYSAVGLYDPLATFFVTAAVVLQVLLAQRPRLDVALLLGAAIGLGLLTKLTTEVALVTLVVSAVTLDWQSEGRGRRLARWCGFALLSVAVAWLIYRVMLLSQWSDDVKSGRKAAHSVHSLSAFLDEPGLWVERNWPGVRGALAGYLTLPLVVALAFGTAVALRRVTRLALFLLVWALAPIAAVVALADVPFGRWILMAFPPLVVLSAVGVVEIVDLVQRAALRLPGGARRAAVPVLAVILLLPAVWLDAQLLSGPSTVRLPARDDVDYQREWSAGGPWFDLVPDLRRMAFAGDLVVAVAARGATYPALALRHDDRIQLVDARADAAESALVAFENGESLPHGPDVLAWRLRRTYERPRGGVPVSLFERVVIRDLEVSATPDELRSNIGGTDADFDVFVRAHPVVQAWLDAWARRGRPA